MLYAVTVIRERRPDAKPMLRTKSTTKNTLSQSLLLLSSSSQAKKTPHTLHGCRCGCSLLLLPQATIAIIKSIRVKNVQFIIYMVKIHFENTHDSLVSSSVCPSHGLFGMYIQCDLPPFTVSTHTHPPSCTTNHKSLRITCAGSA